jgi:hypothetical protein
MSETAAQTTAANQQVIDQATTGTSTAAEFTYTFPDNRVYKAPTQAELLEQVGNRYKELYGHAETLKQENAQFRQSVSQLVNGQQTPQTQGFSQEKYLELWTKNPLEANQYLNAHDPTINAAVNQLEQIQWQQQAGQFREANPDFQMTTDNINHLSRVCDQMFPGTKVVTAAQMEAAHLYCQKQKLYGEGTVTQTTQKAPPPPPPTSSGADTQGAPDINKMDQAQLRQYIESLEQK